MNFSTSEPNLAFQFIILLMSGNGGGGGKEKEIQSPHHRTRYHKTFNVNKIEIIA